MAELKGAEEEALRQESTVNVGGEPLRIVSRILLEPEALTVTRILRGDEELRKQVGTVPAAAVQEYARRGVDALFPCLHKAHLHFVRQVLSAQSRPTQRFEAPAGVFAATVFDGDGKATPIAGAQHVPGSWERAAYVLTALAEVGENRLGLGALERAELEGTNVAAVVGRDSNGSAVLYLDPKEIKVDDERLGPVLDGLLAPSVSG